MATDTRTFEFDSMRGADGSFQRREAAYRELPELEPGRFHLYVSPACPWSHRAIIARRVKELEDAISESWVAPYRDERGWAFSGDEFSDPLEGFGFLREAYEATGGEVPDHITVPVLWDKEDRRVVNNESADLLRLFNAWGDGPDLYPQGLRAEIDAINHRVYETVNNGVYRAGFARSQAAYDRAFTELFESLDWLERRLRARRYLAGDVITEADWRLFPTLVRFDPVYHTHFRCNGRLLTQYPNLWAYARELYQQPGIAETVEPDQIKRHYYTTHDSLNPKRIIPAGPLDLGFE